MGGTRHLLVWCYTQWTPHDITKWPWRPNKERSSMWRRLESQSVITVINTLQDVALHLFWRSADGGAYRGSAAGPSSVCVTGQALPNTSNAFHYSGQTNEKKVINLCGRRWWSGHVWIDRTRRSLAASANECKALTQSGGKTRGYYIFPRVCITWHR